MANEPLDLDAIEALVNAATAGPWHHDRSGVWHVDSGGPVLDANNHRRGDNVGIGTVGDSYPRGPNKPDESMAFIAAARTLVPQLVVRVRELEQDAKRLDWLDGQCQAVGSPDGAEHIANAWGVHGQTNSVRAAIDAAMAEQTR